MPRHLHIVPPPCEDAPADPPAPGSIVVYGLTVELLVRDGYDQTDVLDAMHDLGIAPESEITADTIEDIREQLEVFYRPERTVTMADKPQYTVAALPFRLPGNPHFDCTVYVVWDESANKRASEPFESYAAAKRHADRLNGKDPE